MSDDAMFGNDLGELDLLPPYMLLDFRTGDQGAQDFLLGHGFEKAKDPTWAEDVINIAERYYARRPQASAVTPARQKVFLKLVKAAPFRWVDPTSIPRREWIYGRQYARKFVSTTVAPGGLGKSSLTTVEALAIVSGKPLLEVMPTEQTNVWLFNAEEPFDEIQRRVIAAALHYGLDESDLAGLYANSGRDSEIIIAEQAKAGLVIAKPIVDAVKATILDNNIGLMIVDPFVSTHRVTENDNGAIDAVVKTWARIAEDCNCAIELVHHVRKTIGGQEVTVEDGRGASALLAATRSARVLNVMTQDEADRAGVAMRRLHFRVDKGKGNMSPPAEGSTWFRMTSFVLPNRSQDGIIDDGDDVGVCTSWEWPDRLDGLPPVADLRAAQSAVAGGSFRENPQAKDWAGHAIGAVLGLDTRNTKADRAKIKRWLQIWIDNGMFNVTLRKDSTGQDRPFLEVGEVACD